MCFLVSRIQLVFMIFAVLLVTGCEDSDFVADNELADFGSHIARYETSFSEERIRIVGYDHNDVIHAQVLATAVDEFTVNYELSMVDLPGTQATVHFEIQSVGRLYFLTNMDNDLSISLAGSFSKPKNEEYLSRELEHIGLPSWQIISELSDLVQNASQPMASTDAQVAAFVQKLESTETKEEFVCVVRAWLLDFSQKEMTAAERFEVFLGLNMVAIPVAGLAVAVMVVTTPVWITNVALATVVGAVLAVADQFVALMINPIDEGATPAQWALEDLTDLLTPDFCAAP